ncbi:hypothetical protein LY78DRAFT_363125 [Colletotrichum sublineola]|nr:hypothetical protein LY78DRAFT_363125 [Colletotrichum sublineola]
MGTRASLLSPLTPGIREGKQKEADKGTFFPPPNHSPERFVGLGYVEVLITPPLRIFSHSRTAGTPLEWLLFSPRLGQGRRGPLDLSSLTELLDPFIPPSPNVKGDLREGSMDHWATNFSVDWGQCIRYYSTRYRRIFGVKALEYVPDGPGQTGTERGGGRWDETWA